MFLVAHALAVAIMTASASPAAVDEQVILRAENRVTQAIAGGDAETLDKLWAPEYTFINPGGELMTRERRLALIRKRIYKPDSYTRDDIRVRLYGDTAIVTYHAVEPGSMKGTDIPAERRGMSVWLRHNGVWQVVAQETTPVHPIHPNGSRARH